MGAAASHHFDGTGSQLVRAAKAGDADTLLQLVSAHPVLLRYTTYHHLGACHYAARQSSADALSLLLGKAEEVQAAARADGRPSNLVAQLANLSSDRGVTPLMLAADAGCTDSVALLLSKGADPWAVDKLGGRSALHYAARADAVDVVLLLLEAARGGGPVKFPNRPGIPYVDLRTQTGLPALHFAAAANARGALAALLSRGANMMLSSLFDSLDGVNCPRGSSALHVAARSGHEAAAKQLIKAWVDVWQHRGHADPRLQLDGDDRLPAQVAARRQRTNLARLLLPSTPMATLLDGDDLTVLGPPRLADLAAAALRQQLAGDLATAQQAAAASAALGGADAAAHAAIDEPASRCGSSSSGGDDEACGVCFDSELLLTLRPCGHRVCAACCQHMLEMGTCCVLICPFCRGGVAHLAPPRGAAAAAAPAPPAARSAVVA